MIQAKLMIGLVCLLAGSAISAQQPVKYELTKLAETVVLPPLTPAEAYNKMLVDSKLDEKKLFGSFYDRMDKIGNELYMRTEKQLDISKQDQNAAKKAMENGFGEMSTSEKAEYLKNNPALQNAAGVSSSMLELAAKMEDPDFKKKFDAMSDAEKAKLVMSYQQPQMQLSQKLHSQNGLKVVMEAGKIIDQFNKDYRRHSLTMNKVADEEALDKQEEERLKPVLEEKARLSNLLGKGSPEWVSVKMKETIAKEWAIRNDIFEKKLKLNRDYLISLISSFKMSAKPFDDYLAKINHGAELKARNEAKELAQLGGYQAGLLGEIAAMQDVAKNITLSAAAFYERMQEAKKEK